jgi:hypothetical protein
MEKVKLSEGLVIGVKPGSIVVVMRSEEKY